MSRSATNVERSIGPTVLIEDNMRKELVKRLNDFWNEYLGDFWSPEVRLLFVLITISMW